MGRCRGLPLASWTTKSIATRNDPGPVLACAFQIRFPGFTGRKVDFSQTGYFCPDVVFLREPLREPPMGRNNPLMPGGAT